MKLLPLEAKPFPKVAPFPQSPAAQTPRAPFLSVPICLSPRLPPSSPAAPHLDECLCLCSSLYTPRLTAPTAPCSPLPFEIPAAFPCSKSLTPLNLPWVILARTRDRNDAWEGDTGLLWVPVCSWLSVLYSLPTDQVLSPALTPPRCGSGPG